MIFYLDFVHFLSFITALSIGRHTIHHVYGDLFAHCYGSKQAKLFQNCSD